MDDLLDRVEARGIEIGEARGVEKGREEGVDETRLESIRNLRKKLNLTAEQAMDLLGILTSVWPKYLAKQ